MAGGILLHKFQKFAFTTDYGMRFFLIFQYRVEPQIKNLALTHKFYNYCFGREISLSRLI